MFGKIISNFDEALTKRKGKILNGIILSSWRTRLARVSEDCQVLSTNQPQEEQLSMITKARRCSKRSIRSSSVHQRRPSVDQSTPKTLRAYLKIPGDVWVKIWRAGRQTIYLCDVYSFQRGDWGGRQPTQLVPSRRNYRFYWYYLYWAHFAL